MAQNSFVLDEIDREATKVRADAHLQKSLPGNSLVPYGFDRDTVDQSTKFCTVIPLDI